MRSRTWSLKRSNLSWLLRRSSLNLWKKSESLVCIWILSKEKQLYSAISQRDTASLLDKLVLVSGNWGWRCGMSPGQAQPLACCLASTEALLWAGVWGIQNCIMGCLHKRQTGDKRKGRNPGAGREIPGEVLHLKMPAETEQFRGKVLVVMNFSCWKVLDRNVLKTVWLSLNGKVSVFVGPHAASFW